MSQRVGEVDDVGALQAQAGGVRGGRAAADQNAGEGQRGAGRREQRRGAAPAWPGDRYAPSRSTMKISGEFAGIVGG